MNDHRPVHLCPPAGSRILPCCDRDVDAAVRLTNFAHEVTCTDRKIAELKADTDDGESPFGWREPDVQVRAPALATALRAVRRQCTAWMKPAPSLTWDARNRDLGVAAAARILLDVIDHLVPGLDDADPDEAAQRPRLADRLAAALLTTVRTDCTGQPPQIHGDGGHFYDGRCALCTSDIDALAAALVHTITHTPLPHIGGR